MADTISFDFKEVTKLAADLGRVPDLAGPKIYQAIEQTSFKVRDSWRAKLAGAVSLPGAARSIQFQIGNNEGLFRNTFLGGGANLIVSEIGPRLGSQGSLVFVTEFGSLSTAPRGYGAGALDENADDFRKGLEKALKDAETEAGL